MPQVSKLSELRNHLVHLAPADPRRLLYMAEALALDGQYGHAAEACRLFVQLERARLAIDGHLRNKLAEICFRARDFSPLHAFLQQEYQLDVCIEIESRTLPGVSLWKFHRTGFTFTFSHLLFEHPYMEVIIKHWIQAFPVLLYYARQPESPSGEVPMNLEDLGTVPGLTYCDSREEYRLIPDPIFLQSDAYALEKYHCTTLRLPWSQRKPVAFWRGQSTGWSDCSGIPIRTWRDLPRVKLCEIARQAPTPTNFDVALSGVVVQGPNPQEADEIRQSGLVDRYVPFQDYLNYKYQIDIDGNTSAWAGLFTKLCTGNPVLKVKSSRDYRQWYYDRLIPWYNYIPIEADMADLCDKVDWLMQHDEVAWRIGEHGRSLALQMTVSQEAARAVPTIAAAFHEARQNA